MGFWACCSLCTLACPELRAKVKFKFCAGVRRRHRLWALGNPIWSPGNCSVAIIMLEFCFSRYMGFRIGLRFIIGGVELTSMCAISQLEGADIDGAVEGESSWRVQEKFGGLIAKSKSQLSLGSQC
ncbi:hypothetical protein C8J57DRAFT_1240080 [Mycena rebaudengoi]|nr:hypothetical protein C8J57DRAFT_1240080 [Mycena rebaudengoi]